MSARSATVGIIAGGGSLPREIADTVVASGGRVQIVSFRGEADADFRGLPRAEVEWGQIGRMISIMQRANCRDIIFIGRVKRPDLGKIRPDLGFFRALSSVLRAISAGGDDALLRSVIRFFETAGFRVVGPKDIAPSLVIGAGALGDHAPNERDLLDIATGFDVLRRLGQFDIGQAAVVADGRLIAIEAAEGTDVMLSRIAQHRYSGSDRKLKRSGVLIKRPKPGQELRIDMPTIGPETVSRAVKAGLAGIAIQAGGTLAARRDDLISLADETGTFVFGALAAELSPKIDHALTAFPHFEIAGRHQASAKFRENLRLAASAAAALEGTGAGRTIVVSNRQVLAVEAGEGPFAVMERSRGLVQWGSRRWRRRVGLAYIVGHDFDADLVDAAAGAGLAGLAIGEFPQAAIPADAIARANRAGLVLALVARGAGRS